MQDAGYDMLNCDNGTYDAWYWAHPPIYMPENCNLDDVAHIRKFVDIPVVCAGRMDPRVAADAIKEGKLEEAKAALPCAFSAIDSAAAKNVLHANNAANKKAKLAKKVSKAEAK